MNRSRWTIGASLLVILVATACAGRGEPKTDRDSEAAGKIRLAEAHMRQGRMGDALQMVQEAIDLQPENAALYNFYGQLCFIARRDDEAETAFRKALEIDPYLTDAHNNIGALYDRMGRKQDAEREFLLVLEDPAYPTPEKAYLNLGLLYSSQGRVDEAVTALRKAVEINPKYYQGHFQLASELDREGKLEEAAREYEVAEPGYRDSGEYHFRLGFAYFRLGLHGKARTHLARVREVSPGSEKAVEADEILKLIP